MTRLIDADAFVTEHRKIYCENCERRKNSKGKVVYEVGGVPCRACYIGDVIDDVDSAPTVDAVQVVRKPVKDYEGMYEVDNLARVFSVARVKTVNDNGRVYDKPIVARQLRQSMHSKGYKTVSLTKDGVTKTYFVHRLVADAFIENPNNLPMINHKDEDKTNNLPENLEWCDALYNTMYGKGRKKRAKKIRGKPLSEEHKKKISESLKYYHQVYCADGERKTNGDC